MIRVLVADESAQVTGNITRRLALEDDLEVCGTAADGESAVQQALWLKPDVAVVDAGLPGMDGGQTTQMLGQSLPGTGVIMMSMEAENDAYRQAMLAGAREFLHKPFTGDDLVIAVRRVHALQQRRVASTAAAATTAAASSVVASTVDAAVPAREGSAPRAARVSARGQVIAVLSGKGGVGTTVTAINIAVLLGQAHPGRVALVDLSLQFGDVGAALNLPTTRTITDLLSDNGTADLDVVGQVLVPGPASIMVLLAPTSPEVADSITAGQVASLVETLRGDFDFIIIDTPSYLTEASLRAVELADRIVMLSDLSVTGIKNARLTRSVLETVGVDAGQVVVVANHREAAGELDRRGAETFLGAHIAVEIPYSADVVATSVNKGVPFVIASPSAPPSAALRALVALVAPLSRNSGEPDPNGESGDRKRRGRRKLSFSR